MEANPADIWEQVVSQSISKLSTGTPSVAPLRKLEVKATAQKRHHLTRDREPGKIDVELRQTIRDAAAGKVKWPLFICGKPGTGKTCAGLCVADHVHGSEWWSWDDFWRYLNDVNFGRAVSRRGGDMNPEGYRELTTTITWTAPKWWTWFKGLPLAIIDDIGLRANANDTQYEALKMALDVRENLPLIVTSNLDAVGIGMIFDLRVMDRLSCGTVIDLQGRSQR